MDKNAGSKLVSKEGNLPGYGPVYYNKDSISNLFSISEVIQRGFCVTFDSDVKNEFQVHLHDGDVIKFPLNECGLYLKEKIRYEEKKPALAHVILLK